MKTLFKTLLELLVIGVVVGLLISFYQFIVHEVIHLSDSIITSNNTLIVSITLGVVVILSFIIIFINNKYKGYLGSGLPQYEAYYEDKLEFSPYKMGLLVFFDSLFAFFCGFPFGSEGPSITISASVARIIDKLFNKEEDKEIVSIAGSAGYAVAFLAPLASLFHLIEENIHYVKPKYLLKGIFLIAIALLVGYLVYPHSLLPIKVENALDYKFYYIIPIVAIACFILARLFVLIMIKIKDMSKLFKNFTLLTPIFVLLFLYLKTKDFYIVGSGSTILDDPLFSSSILLLIFYLVYRMIGTSLSNSLAVSGGLVLPTLTLGCLTGLIIYQIFVEVFPELTGNHAIFCVIGMLSFYNSTFKTPLTSFFLGIEMSSLKFIALPLGIAILTTTLLMFVLKQRSVYKLLEKRIV